MAYILLLTAVRMTGQQSAETRRRVTRAEISFDTFPSDHSAFAARRALAAVEGVIDVLFDPCVRRAQLSFDPTKVCVSCLLATLQPFGPNPRVVSLATPTGGFAGQKDQQLL